MTMCDFCDVNEAEHLHGVQPLTDTLVKVYDIECRYTSAATSLALCGTCTEWFTPEALEGLVVRASPSILAGLSPQPPAEWDTDFTRSVILLRYNLRTGSVRPITPDGAT
jgi:hypothetical protein